MIRSTPLASPDGADRHDGSFGVFYPTGLEVRPESILRVHGYRDPTKVQKKLKSAAEAIAGRMAQLAEPEIYHRRVGVIRAESDKLVLENGTCFCSPAFFKHLADARSVMVTVTTIGGRVDEAVVTAIETFETLDALFLKTAGWLAIQATTKQFADLLRTAVREEGLHVSIRMAPCYMYRDGDAEVGWPLEEQKTLFDVFDGIDLPVHVMENCAMTPKMSRSGIYGLSPVM